jgi:hypothetical protein
VDPSADFSEHYSAHVNLALRDAVVRDIDSPAPPPRRQNVSMRGR